MRLACTVEKFLNLRLLIAHDETCSECAVAALLSCQTTTRAGNDFRA